ncbi:myosin heavy chain, skeletal muscle-like [Eriocheir sinensis]|uniref:myosin heavy chain, skeletal muscle-like n=1 Tax=Eriocheir sinensis TaxID=95602 RepID=UPI0021C7BC2B|nr:myosin heavy chain, skeletal muscle-like [Eriocheir sinensis]
MDNPGHSIFAGGSLHLDGITANNEEEDLQREEEEEEENRRREQEIQDLLVNVFDDLEDEESYSHHSGHPYTVPGGGGEGDEGGGSGLGGALPEAYPTPTHHQVSHSSYQDNQSDIYGHQDAYHQDGQFGGFPEDRQSLEDVSHRSSSSSVAPWSEDSRGTSPTMFHPLQGHDTAGNDLDDGTMVGDPYERDYRPMEDPECRGSHVEAYSSDHFHPQHLARQDNQDMLDLNDQYKEAETSYTQLKLLYEVRGRELDRQMSDFAKLQFESSRDIRALQHQLNLMRSENEGKSASIKQLQILLSEKDERVKALVTDMKDIQSKLLAQQDENKKLHLELETAESTISSLECQVSELKAMDSLSRNQKLQEEFIQKLQQGNQENKDMLLSKLHESQKEAQVSQQEVKRLREELRNVRNMYDGAVVQKTETVAKLNLTVETLRKQYEQLLQAHDSQEILKLELKVKSLEASNRNWEEHASMLEIELKKTKEDLKSYDMAMKLGVMKEVIPEDDSMVVLGIKKTLNYNDTVAKDTLEGGGNKCNKKLPDGDEGLKISEELKKSLMINKAKREEIAMLREDMQEKQARIRKAASDLRDAHVEIKQLKERILKLEMEKDEREVREGSNENGLRRRGGTSSSVNREEEIQVENSSLRQEVAHLMACVREANQHYNNLRDAVTAFKNTLHDSPSKEQLVPVITKVDEFLSLAENGRKLSGEVEYLHEMLTDMRKENATLHQAQTLWERRLGGLEVSLKVSEKMIRRVVTDPEKASEITPSLTTLQKLLTDLGEMVTVVKSEVQEAHQDKLRLQSKLSTCQMEVEKAKDRVAKLEQEKGNLEAQAADLERNKQMEKNAELESYQRTYLKFHEEAMHELEANVKVEYERIVTDLKEKIVELGRELKEAKECYIQVCQEKNQLEERLEHLENRPVPEESQRTQQGTRTTLSTPDSGISGEAVVHKPQQAQETMQNKEIETLKEELVFVKARYMEQSKNMEKQREQFALICGQHSEEVDNRARQRSSHGTREMQETCSKLEKLNQELRDKCQDQEAEIVRLKEALSEEAMSEDKGAWKAILERQQKRMNEEKEELRTYFRNTIEELQNKYTQVGTSQLLEDKVMEQVTAMKTKNDKITELKNVNATISRELEKAKASLQVQEEEREKEVEKLTDMIQKREDELREKQEQTDVIRHGFQSYMEKAKAELEGKERKNIHLKLKLKKYNEMRNQIKFYKDELEKVWEEFADTKAAITERMQSCLEEVKGMFVEQVESVKESLSGIEGSKQVAETLQELDELAANVKNIKLII